MTAETKRIEETKRLMGALVRMKPKPHEDMRVGKAKDKKKKPKKGADNEPPGKR